MTVFAEKSKYAVKSDLLIFWGYIFRSPRINGQLLRINVRRKYEIWPRLILKKLPNG